MTTGLVDRACLIGDLVLGHVLEGVESIATMATIVLHLARDEDLGSNIDLGPQTSACNFDPVRDGGCSSLSPA